MLHSSPAFEGGFTAPVFDAQSVFHSLMHAMSNPGRKMPIAALTTPPAPLSIEMGAVAAALFDHDTPIWCDAEISASEEALAWLTFHTGAPIVSDPAKAQFALVSDAHAMPELATFAQGTAEFPDRSTTIIVVISSFEAGEHLVLKGPGIETTAQFQVNGLPLDFLAQWNLNRVAFPCGVDLMLLGAGHVAALPRTTRISELEA